VAAEPPDSKIRWDSESRIAVLARASSNLAVSQSELGLYGVYVTAVSVESFDDVTKRLWHNERCCHGIYFGRTEENHGVTAIPLYSYMFMVWCLILPFATDAHRRAFSQVRSG
jgi:hypothetical protein